MMNGNCNNSSDSENSDIVVLSKVEEIKVFLREYKNLDNTKLDYYYIIPFSWIKDWDKYIVDDK
jgi:hypothetical protein